MIPILLSIGLALAVMFAATTVKLGVVSVHRARAQLAADAAALGAIAESAPHGHGRHELEARKMAEANGARLLTCWCSPGATSVQVRVAVRDVMAEARAVLGAPDSWSQKPMRPWDRSGPRPFTGLRRRASHPTGTEIRMRARAR